LALFAFTDSVQEVAAVRFPCTTRQSKSANNLESYVWLMPISVQRFLQRGYAISSRKKPKCDILKLVYSKGSITETGKKQERWKLIYGLKKSSLKALISSA